MITTTQEKKYVKNFLLSIVLFLILLVIQTFTIELLPMPTAGIVFFTLLPVLPLIWTFFIFKSHFKSLDEYVQRLTGEAFLWVLGILCLFSFGYGMLAMKFTLPEVNIAYILPVVFGGHGPIVKILLWVNSREK